MRILLCGPDQGFIDNLTLAGNAEYITCTNAGQTMTAEAINIAVIADSLPDWETLARRLVGQGTVTYIITGNIANINLWKLSAEIGCKDVWSFDSAATELAAITKEGLQPPDQSSSQRPFRRQISRDPAQHLLNNIMPQPAAQQGPSFTQQVHTQKPISYQSQQSKPTSIIAVRKELICFFGTNGGVAKTTMAINVGIALAKQGQSVVIVDFDVFSGDVSTRLKTKPTTTMVDWIKGNSDDLSQCLTEHPSGLKILPAPLNHEEGELIDPEVSSKILSVLTRRFDVVIVDTAPLLIAPTLVTMENATKVYILCPPDSATVAQTNRILKRLDMLNFERYKLKLLVTKMPKRNPLRVNDMQAALGLELAGIIPYDEAVQIETNLGNPPVLSRRAKNFSKSVFALCSSIVPKQQAAARGGFFLNLFKRQTGGAY